MVHIHCNLRGLVMLAVVFLIAIGACDVLRYPGEGPPMMVAGPLLVLVDVVYRLIRGDGHWLLPDRGGSLFFVPIWCWGALWLVLGVVYTLRPASA